MSFRDQFWQYAMPIPSDCQILIKIIVKSVYQKLQTLRISLVLAIKFKRKNYQQIKIVWLGKYENALIEKSMRRNIHVSS